MNNPLEFGEEKHEEFPHNQITLLDGRTLDCYPLAGEVPEKIAEDHLKIDTTGRYFTIGTRKPSPDPKPSEEAKEQRQLFIRNAFYLLAHKERILSDSRMFLCRVPIQSGMAYTGISGFNKPTLGVYIEWWTNVSTSMYVDENGRRTLVYLLSGSPLTGANSCGIVHEDGETESAWLKFHSLWSPFIKVNRRYTQAKELYQAYTLEEVLDILHQEDDNCQTFEHSIDKVFMECEIKFLKQEIEKLQGDRDNWQRIYEDTLFRYNEDRIRQFYADFLEMESQTNAEIDQTKQKIKELKADLRNKVVNNKTYQQKLRLLKGHISSLEFKISRFQSETVRETFSDEKDITFNLIERYASQDSDEKDNENQ